MSCTTRNLTVAVLVITDLFTLYVAYFLAFCLRWILLGRAPWHDILHIYTLLPVFVLLLTTARLYPGFMLSGPDMLKRYTIYTSLGFLFISTLFFIGQRGIDYSRFIFFMAWGLSLIMLPTARTLIRYLCKKASWWGFPVTIIGTHKHSVILAQQLRLSPQQGFKPEGIFFSKEDGTPPSMATGLNSPRPLMGTPSEQDQIIDEYTEEHKATTGVLVMQGLTALEQAELCHIANKHFKHIVIIPDEIPGIRLSLTIAVFGTRLAFHLRQNLLDPYRLHIKRAMDLLLVIIGLVPLVPLTIIISCAIFINNPGPIFYRQKRIGQHGRALHVWKFRTMIKNADAVLAQYLASVPAMQAEWDRDHKLKYDPRVTKVGQILRKYSLDELPQVLNVLIGDMSLVGPRPIVEAEIPKYGKAYETYTLVKPGLTGLWQVSGRNNVSYNNRVALDEYYIANWSVWQDIYILVRTIPAAIFGRGAY